jgi:hypothetical protein
MSEIEWSIIQEKSLSVWRKRPPSGIFDSFTDIKGDDKEISCHLLTWTYKVS